MLLNPIIKMRFSTIFTGAFAALATAAPVTESPAAEKRGVFNAAQLNGLGFNSLDLSYLNVINSFDLGLLQQLSVQNNFNSLAFESLFSSNVFNVNSILQLQQLQVLLQLGQLGVFNTFDLGSLQLELLQLGLVSNVGAFDLSSLIDASLVPQIQAIASQQGKLLQQHVSTMALS